MDLARAVAEKLGVELEIRELPFDQLLPALQNGEADFVLSGIERSEERDSMVDFTEPYYAADAGDGADTIRAGAYCAAVPEGSDLCGFINDVLSELKENGELERLIKMYN